MAYETLLYEVDDRVATITLNRPERHNALSQKLCAELMEVVRAADQDPSVRVLVITGAGGKAFSAGYDIKESAEAPKRTLSEWRDRLNRDLRFCYAPWECSKPVIAMIDGFCLAGALEFAQMCDIRYCSEDAKFGVLESRFAGGIVTMIMPWILGAACRELIYTGDMIGAAARRGWRRRYAGATRNSRLTSESSIRGPLSPGRGVGVRQLARRIRVRRLERHER